MNFEFSKAIHELRLSRKLSQRSAAQDLGISQALLSHYENGVRQPKLAFVRKIAKYYGVSADELLGHPASERDITECEQKLMSDITGIIDLVEKRCGAGTADIACEYLSEAVCNVRRIIEEPDCPYDPRRYTSMKGAEAALFDAAKSITDAEKE